MKNSNLKLKVIRDSLRKRGIKCVIKSSPQKNSINIKVSEDCYLVTNDMSKYTERCMQT